MPVDPRFHPAGPPLTLGEAAALVGAEARGDANLLLRTVGPLEEAGPDALSFLDNRRYLPALAATRAGAVVLSADLAGRLPEGVAGLLSPTPYLAFARLAARLHPARPARGGVHPSAIVDPTARLATDAEVGPQAVIGAGAEIGPGCIIGPLAVIGEGVVLGPNCRIGAHASLSHAILGQGVVVHPGARIGQEGFGFALAPGGRFETVPQLGRVLLGDFVDVGANACIDRGSQRDTVLGAGTRLDNMVQVAHNVQTGRACVLVAQVGISGSVTLGDGVQIGGQAGVAGHLTVGSGAQVAAQSGVMNDLEAGAKVGGTPAWPLRETFRAIAALRKLAGRGN